MLQVSLTYTAMLIFFVLSEILVLTNIMQPLFLKNIGHLMRENTNLAMAAFFYFFYVAGVYWFATKAGLRAESLIVAVLSGGFLGFLAFGTYEFTNFLILKDWKMNLVIVDTLWGVLISGAMAGVGFQVFKWFE
ncbi:MAG: hypothetical protein CML37_04395 [Rhodobacteraceae bacterium]|nr:hypothetical protein [Paracoccaceae bacterium]